MLIPVHKPPNPSSTPVSPKTLVSRLNAVTAHDRKKVTTASRQGCIHETNNTLVSENDDLMLHYLERYHYKHFMPKYIQIGANTLTPIGLIERFHINLTTRSVIPVEYYVPWKEPHNAELYIHYLTFP